MTDFDWRLAAPTAQKERIKDLVGLIPKTDRTLLEIGARDGYMTRLLALFFDEVTALDLNRPDIDYPRVTPVQGNVAELDFSEGQFDAVLCSEVLEHLPPSKLRQACNELTRVAKNHIIIGVPFEQDLRIGRITCSRCGRINPPYGHRNSFTKAGLIELFGIAKPTTVHYLGSADNWRTNWLSVYLFDLAGNPYGPYEQAELCLQCDRPIGRSQERNFFQKLSSKLGFTINRVLYCTSTYKPTHVHMLFEKQRRSRPWKVE